MWQVYGQDHLLRQLEPSLRQGRLAHAYLLVGPPRVGKMTLARQLAQSVNCLEGPGVPCGECVQCRRIAQGIHADVRTVAVGAGQENGPTRTVIGIDDVKNALHHLNLKSYEGACSVLIFDGAHLLSEEAANALLKTLEEPPPQVLILLLTTDEDALLSTLKSRCRRLGLMPVSKSQIVERLVSERQADPETAERLGRLSRGCMGWALTAWEDPQVLDQLEADLARLQEVCQSGLDTRFGYAAELAGQFSRARDPVRELLYLWLRWWRDLLLVKESAEEYIQNQDHLTQLRLQASRLSTVQVVNTVKSLQQTLEALDHNANPRLALEVLMLNLPGSG